jgi:hypothetical protein
MRDPVTKPWEASMLPSVDRKLMFLCKGFPLPSLLKLIFSLRAGRLFSPLKIVLAMDESFALNRLLDDIDSDELDWFLRGVRYVRLLDLSCSSFGGALEGKYAKESDELSPMREFDAEFPSSFESLQEEDDLWRRGHRRRGLCG